MKWGQMQSCYFVPRSVQSNRNGWTRWEEREGETVGFERENTYRLSHQPIDRSIEWADLNPTWKHTRSNLYPARWSVTCLVYHFWGFISNHLTKKGESGAFDGRVRLQLGIIPHFKICSLCTCPKDPGSVGQNRRRIRIRTDNKSSWNSISYHTQRTSSEKTAINWPIVNSLPYSECASQRSLSTNDINITGGLRDWRNSV